MRLAALAARQRPDLPSIDELIEMTYSRRRFLKVSAFMAAATAVGCTPKRSSDTPRAGAGAKGGAARIAIVGAGMAGLNTAYKLHQAGLTAKVFEGSDRTGGRMFTAKDLLGAGITTELGGE